MRRRQRKKKFLREFTVNGFEVAFSLARDLTRERRNTLLDDFLVNAIEANGLLFGGGGGSHEWSGFVVRAAPRASATDADRDAVRRWRHSTENISDINVGPLRDAYHGWGEFLEDSVRYNT